MTNFRGDDGTALRPGFEAGTFFFHFHQVVFANTQHQQSGAGHVDG